MPANVVRPTYDRAKVTPGIVHLGIGAFHRAHMAVYVEKLLAASPGWGIVGASLRRPDTKEALAPQDGLYTVAVRDASGTRCEVIGSVIRLLDANTERAELIATMADPQIRIISLTVTEKGYCHDPATGELDENHPDIVHDLANPDAPVSAPGLIVAAIARRAASRTTGASENSGDDRASTAVHIVRRVIIGDDNVADGAAGRRPRGPESRTSRARYPPARRAGFRQSHLDRTSAEEPDADN